MSNAYQSKHKGRAIDQSVIDVAKLKTDMAQAKVDIANLNKNKANSNTVPKSIKDLEPNASLIHIGVEEPSINCDVWVYPNSETEYVIRIRNNSGVWVDVASGSGSIDEDHVREIVLEELERADYATTTRLEEVEAVAKGRATGYVFDTEDDMNVWLENEENVAQLVLGDNFYIRDTDVPDYWWDGTQAQQLETQKVDLTEYARREDVSKNVVDGEAEGSIRTIGADENIGSYSFAQGYNSIAISDYSSVFGCDCIAGVMGYYWYSIDFDTNQIVLTKEQAVEPTEAFEIPYSVGDVISIINGSKYEESATITAINNNVITVDALPFTSVPEITDYDLDDCSMHVPAKPTLGEIAFGNYAHAEGVGSMALEWASHAEGRDGRAIGQYSHVEGRGCLAVYGAHAEGRDTSAGAIYAHAEGMYTQANGIVSHSEGRNTQAIGGYSHTEGCYTIARGENQHVEGKYNIEDTTSIHIAGNGTSDTARSNAYKLTKSGNGYFAGSVYVKSANDDSKAQKLTTNVLDGKAIGSIASIASTATGNYACAEGSGATASGEASHAEGRATKAQGNYAHAEGTNTQAIGNCAHAEGSTVKAIGNFSHAEGLNVIASGRAQHVEGKYNIEDTENRYAHIVGNGENYINRSNAYTLDWNGNGWYAGSVTVGKATTDDDGDLVLVTKGFLKSYVENAIKSYVDEAILGGVW